MMVMARWRPVLVSVLACAVSVSFGTPTGAQERNVEDQGAAAALVAQRGVLAESILAAKEEARGETFDAAFRASLKNRMEALSAEQLAALAEKGALANIPKVLGATGNDLVYTPVTPCRIFDSRVSQGGPGPIPANTQRNVLVAGTAGFPAQGGFAGGCGVPYGRATAAIVNFVSVSPSGAGNLRAWAVANPQPVAPLAAVMNFGVVAGLPALANGVAVPICDSAVTSCLLGDLRLQADTATTEVVGDVVGYFAPPTSVPGLLLTQLQGETGTASGTPTGYYNLTTNYVPAVNARAFTFMRCSKYGTAVGQDLAFRSAFRTPTGGAVTVGTAYYLDATTSGTGTNAVYMQNDDTFLLTAGQSYDFGVNFASVPGGSGWCSALVQVFTR